MQNPIPLEKGVISFTKFCMRSQANLKKLYGVQTQSSQKELVLSGPVQRTYKQLFVCVVHQHILSTLTHK